MAYADGFSRDPAANSSPPPLGAPQGGLPVKRISATFRTLMAGVAECWNGATDGAVGVKNLRGMAVQDPAAVAITGGRIGSGVVIEGGTTLVWGLSPQQFYDTLYPLGDVRWLASGVQLVVPSIITASWVQLANGFVAVTGTLAQAGTTLAGGWDTTDGGGVNPWNGTTAGTALTLAQVPAGLDVGVTTFDPPTTGDQANFGTQQSINSIKNTGGGQAHTHGFTVAAVPPHHHTLTPPQLYLAAWKRVS
jgi:hypothetical protein